MSTLSLSLSLSVRVSAIYLYKGGDGCRPELGDGFSALEMIKF